VIKCRCNRLIRPYLWTLVGPLLYITDSFLFVCCLQSGRSSEKSEEGSSSPPSGGASGGGPSGGPEGSCPQCRQLLCSCPIKSSTDLLNYQRLASSVPSLVYHGGSTPSNPNSIPNPPYSPDQVAYLSLAAANAFYSMNVSHFIYDQALVLSLSLSFQYSSFPPLNGILSKLGETLSH
jgi:hypothetical protein